MGKCFLEIDYLRFSEFPHVQGSEKIGSAIQHSLEIRLVTRPELILFLLPEHIGQSAEPELALLHPNIFRGVEFPGVELGIDLF